MKRRFIIVLATVDMDGEDGTIGDIIEAVGPRGTVVRSGDKQLAKRYSSLKRALDAAQGWTWYCDVVRVMEVKR